MNKTLKFILALTIFTVLVSCKTTPRNSDSITRIPYSRIAGDIEFWNDRKESPFVRLNDFLVSIKTDDSYELTLVNQNGQRRVIKSLSDVASGTVQLPKMSLEEAKNWTLFVNKPEWQVRIIPNIKIVLPSNKVRYRDFFVVLKDYDRRRDEVDTVPSWLRQDFYRFLISFQKPSTVEYLNEKGEQIKYDTENGRSLLLKLNEEYYKENGWLVFSAIPESIIPLN